MHLNYLLYILCFTSAIAYGQTGTVSTVAQEGAWCWFADPRAIHYENSKGTINATYIGYIDRHGSIKAAQIDHLKNIRSEVLIRSYFQPDDHNNPTFLVLPDERIMIFYSRHTDEPCFYYRVSKKKGDITTLGKEVRLETKNNTTYPSPFILSDDPDHIYLCWRGINWHPTIARLTLPDANDSVTFDWGPYQIVRSKKGAGGTRPYAKYTSNGKDKIYLAYTTTHPDNQSVNYIYFNYININTKALTDVKGNKLSVIGDVLLHDVDATKAYKESQPYALVDDSPFRNWLWELALDKEECPVIATVGISDDKKSHSYYYIRWTGHDWQKFFIAHAGGHFHQTPGIENCYSGGLAIDKADPRIVYASVPVSGNHGRVYELNKYAVDDNGTVTSVLPVTANSPKNNVRPFMIPGLPGNRSLVWMYGDYYDWIVSAARPLGYNTAIMTNMDMPSLKPDLAKRLLWQQATASFSSHQPVRVNVKRSGSFTIAMQLSVDTTSYYGEMIRWPGFVYGVGKGDLPKPYLKIGDRLWESTNVLGNADSWQNHSRSTSGKWYTPQKLVSFKLAITYEKGVLKTYIDGLLDQYVEVKGLQLSHITIGGLNGSASGLKIYSRALDPGEINLF